MALADKRVRELIAGKQVRNIIVVPGKLVNIVVG
jgi:leucyl-tRNA synthetase